MITGVDFTLRITSSLMLTSYKANPCMPAEIFLHSYDQYTERVRGYFTVNALCK